MAHDIYFISDTHFGHDNCWKLFKQPDGVTPLRPFTSTQEMDEMMISNWNNVVKPQDHVYHLGDIVINKKFMPLLSRLMGHKRLVPGNHDMYPELHAPYFEKIYGVRVFDDMILSHIPLKETSITPRFGTNVHGHLHGNCENDPRYLCVSVEHINYTPIHIDEVRQRIKQNQKSFENTGSVIHFQTGKLWREVNTGRGSAAS